MILQFHLNMCFDNGIMPSDWGKCIINSIPKSSTFDKRDPLSDRGISLAPAMYKLYCSILNRRLSFWSERNDKVVDEHLLLVMRLYPAPSSPPPTQFWHAGFHPLSSGIRYAEPWYAVRQTSSKWYAYAEFNVKTYHWTRKVNKMFPRSLCSLDFLMKSSCFFFFLSITSHSKTWHHQSYLVAETIK